jgi:hypothetical protein
MLAPESSPIHQLVAPWWLTTTRPRLWKIPALRESLWEAALGEIRANAALGRVYDPGSDSRFTWASQFLNRAAGDRLTIDPDTTARCAYCFDPPLTASHADLASRNLD